MKSKILSFTLFVSVLTLFNCQQKTKVNVDYKYSDQPNVLTCKLADSTLIKEAIYSFENDIKNAYDKEGKNTIKAYTSFINFTRRKTFNLNIVASKHSLDIAKALQASSYYKNNVFSYNSELSDCLFSNIKSPNTKKTFNALRDANSLRPNVVLPTFVNLGRELNIDKSLAGILAFDYYYNSLMLLNESDLKTPITKPAGDQKIDFNKLPRTQQKTTPTKKVQERGHEGHNH